MVEFAGELTLRTIADAHARLHEAFEAGPVVTARIEADATVDLSFVQLLESARRTARDAGGAFALAAPAEQGLLETLRRGGFIQTHNQRAFWLQEQTAGTQ
jgi:hypothetical protein